MKKFDFAGGGFVLSGRAVIMGILNVTPDSFSDGGRYLSPEDALKRAGEMLRQGADIIDIGAMSTRPGSAPVTPDEEIGRLSPVLKALSKNSEAVISVDTVNPETAEFSLENGAHIINDVSGVFNAETAQTVKKYNAGWIVTHTCGVPAGTSVDYPDGVVKSVNDFFDSVLRKCAEYGIEKSHICLDAGFGFAKTVDDNIELLKNLDKTVRNDTAFLTGLSRKRFIGALTETEKADERVIGTVAADIIALMKGSDIIRVHDVKEAVQSVQIFNSII